MITEKTGDKMKILIPVEEREREKLSKMQSEGITVMKGTVISCEPP